MAKKKNLDEITEVAESTNVIDASEVKIDADALAASIDGVDTSIPSNEEIIKDIEEKIKKEIEPIKVLAEQVNNTTKTQDAFAQAISKNPENAEAIITNEINKAELLKGEIEKIIKSTEKKISKSVNTTNWWNGMGYDL